MAAAGFFNHALTAGHALSGVAASPMEDTSGGATGANGTSASSGSNDSGSDSATISANDFLTLLVTEMQNQDPTADTDPNEYIDQLVQVNSLEQLIDINQTLSTSLGATSGSADSGSATGQADAASSPLSTATSGSATGSRLAAIRSKTSLSSTPAGAAAAGVTAVQSSGSKRASGNLSTPVANPAAERVAHALNGRTRARPAARTVSAMQ